jgi:hypothetical protein
LPRRSLAYGNSRFCFEEGTKPADEHHLQACPTLSKPYLVSHDKLLPFTNYCIQHAGIGNKLVTAFAATWIDYVTSEEI